MARVKTGMTGNEVEARLGMPARKVGTPEVDIWAYDLGTVGNYIYSIRVAFNLGQVSQVYLGMEMTVR